MFLRQRTNGSSSSHSSIIQKECTRVRMLVKGLDDQAKLASSFRTPRKDRASDFGADDMGVLQSLDED